ncbi:hypothetical protein F2Q69_00040780, partial [Brassica cretica]
MSLHQRISSESSTYLLMISDYLLLILPKLHSFASSNLASCLHPMPSLQESI